MAKATHSVSIFEDKDTWEDGHGILHISHAYDADEYKMTPERLLIGRTLGKRSVYERTPGEEVPVLFGLLISRKKFLKKIARVCNVHIVDATEDKPVGYES